MTINTDTLESVCELIVDCPHSTPKWTDSGLIVLRNQNIRNGRLDLSNPSYTDEKHFQQRIKRAEPQAGDIVFTREAPMGEVCMIPEGVKCCLGQRQVLLRPKKEVNGKYLLFALQSPNVQHEISWNEGTGSTVSNVRIPVLKSLNIPRHPGEEDSIAEILSSLSDKIELNRQINQTFEQIAQAIFKSWFVDFEPVKAKIEAKQNGHDTERAAMRAICGKTDEQLDQLSHEQRQQLTTTAAHFPDEYEDSELGDIPKGWNVSCVEDVCNFQNGYAFKSKEMSKSPIGTYKVFKMGGIKKGGGLNKTATKDYFEKSKCEKLDRYIIKKGDLLMCMTDMKNNVALLGHTALMDMDDEYMLNQRVGLLRTKDKNQANYPFLYILTNSLAFIEDLRSRANSGVQVNLSTKEIKETKFVLPSEEIHIAFDQLTERLQEQIFSLETEQEYLASIRDSLLPKLLSGEITLGDTQSKTEAVA